MPSRELFVRYRILLLLFAAAFVALGALDGSFFSFDDNSMIVENGLNTGHVPLSHIFLHYHFNTYAPLHYLLVYVEWHLSSGTPYLFRVVSTMLHAGAAFGCWRMLAAVTRRETLAYGIALLWALHPVHCEAVDWIIEQKSLLSGLFVFWSIAAYADSSRSVRGRIYLSLALMVAACLSKSDGLIAGPIIVLYEFLLAPAAGSRVTRLLRGIPFLAVSVIFAFVALGGVGNLEQLTQWTLSDTILNMPAALLLYVKTAFLPWHASFFYDVGRVTSVSDKGFWLPLTIEVGVFAAGFAACAAGGVANSSGSATTSSTVSFWARPSRRNERVSRPLANSTRLLLFSAAAWLLALGPMLNFSIWTFPAHDRYQYKSLPWLLLCAALAVEGILRFLIRKTESRKPIFQGLCVVFALVLATLGLLRGALFSHEEALMQDAIVKAPGNAWGYLGLAGAYMKQWHKAEAENRAGDQRVLAENVARATMKAQGCWNFNEFVLQPASNLLNSATILRKSGMPGQALRLMETVVREPRFAAFKEDRAMAHLGIAELELNSIRDESPPASSEQIVREALKHCDESQVWPEFNDARLFTEHIAHLQLARLAKKSGDAATERKELELSLDALRRITPRYPFSAQARREADIMEAELGKHGK